jgi:HAD superfamily hydrolase (TIGR01450 family)
VKFATNNSASTAQLVAAKLESLGITCGIQDVVTSGQMAARQVLEFTRPGAEVLVIGSPALAAELAALGLARTMDVQQAEAVVVGLDPDFSYRHLADALTALSRGLPLVGCNRDVSYPGPGGTRLPGCGPLLAAVEAVAGRTADALAGKPSPAMLIELARRTGTRLDAWFVVGDEIDADLAMARAAGVPATLVGTDRCQDLAAFGRQVLAEPG